VVTALGITQIFAWGQFIRGDAAEGRLDDYIALADVTAYKAVS
jgi:hypothetical protein